MGKVFGYIRVSSVDQNASRQLEGIAVDKLFEDKASGKDTRRPALALLKEFVREGDTVVIHSMDRLARSLDDLRSLVQAFNRQGVTVQFVKESLVFTGEDTPIANLMLSIMGAVAEFERSMVRERQAEGIAIAKARGVYKGRKPSVTPQMLEEILRRIAAGEPKAAIARELKISRATLYSHLKNRNFEEPSNR